MNIPIGLVCGLCLVATLAPARPAESRPTLEEKLKSVLPTVDEELWLQVPWRLDLVQARVEAQRSGKPLFLWINEGHPLGCV